MLKDSFIGCDVVKSLMTGTVDAATAAEGFNIITAEMTQTKKQWQKTDFNKLIRDNI